MLDVAFRTERCCVDPVEAELNAICDDEVFETRWHLKDLVDGREWSRLGDVSGFSASTRKVSVMMTLLSHAHRGKVDLDAKVHFTPDYVEGVRSGTFRYMTPGFRLSLRDALGQMIITSDNVCTRLVFDALGATPTEQLQAANDYCQSIGLRQTVHRHVFPDTKAIPWYHTDEPMTTTTASDQVRLLDLVVRGANDEEAARALGCSPELCRYALTLMTREYAGRMGTHLPASAVMAAKGGRGVRGRSHIGVAYAGGVPRYALAVYTEWVPVELLDGSPGYLRALSAIARLNRRAWDLLVQPSLEGAA